MHISVATLFDAHYLKSRLRSSDRIELETATGRSAEQIVPLSFELSQAAYTVRAEEGGKPLAMYGVTHDPHTPDVGVVWMLCTPGISKVGKAFLKEMPRILRGFLLMYPDGLHNLALFTKGNDINLRWIKAAGFEFGDLVARNGKPFIYFFKRP